MNNSIKKYEGYDLQEIDKRLLKGFYVRDEEELMNEEDAQEVKEEKDNE